LLIALVLGYEVLGKLGRAADTWAASMPRRPTEVYRAYGPITVAGRLLKLDRQHMTNALGYAANMGIGVAEGGMMDHYYSLINRNGVLAAQLAAAGDAANSESTIEGSTGLYRSFVGTVPASLPGLIRKLGSDWEVLTVEQKRLPGTWQNTVAIELLLDLVKTRKLKAHGVSRVNVFMLDWHEAEARNNEVLSQGPFTASSLAGSSLPYALAVVLLDGRMALDRYAADADVNDPAVASVMQIIHLTFEDGHGENYCRIEVYMIDGSKLVREAETFAYQFPPTVWGDWLQERGSRLLPLKQLKQLEHLVSDLENLDDVSKLMACVVPADVPA